MRAEGLATPAFTLFMNYNPAWKVQKAYDEIYAPGRYRELWFYWEGKPLLMSPLDGTTAPAVLDFFTWRQTWAFDTATHQWLFLDTYPQDASQLAFGDGRSEQIVVAKGLGSPLYHPSETHGKGSSATADNWPAVDELWLTSETGRGAFFEEQWVRAHAVDPAVVLVTGWNEWTAGSWPADEGLVNAGYTFMGRPLELGDIFFVDQFNREFNRDVEPMKDLDTDNYYYQLAAHIRRYKGVNVPRWGGPAHTMAIDGAFDEWAAVTPLYEDPPGDTEHRDWLSMVDSDNHSYVNNTGRNDLVEARVAWDETTLAFYARTSADLTPYTDPRWMLLFIDADQNAATGWAGYEYVTNLEVASATRTSLHQWVAGAWVRIATPDYRADGDQLELALARTAIAEAERLIAFDFKWADNPAQLTP